MKLGWTLGILLVGVFSTAPALALTITNSDAKPHTLKVTAGSDTSQVNVPPNQQVENVCPAGCLIELENGEKYQLGGKETVSIDGGVIFVDKSGD